MCHEDVVRSTDLEIGDKGVKLCGWCEPVCGFRHVLTASGGDLFGDTMATERRVAARRSHCSVELL